MNVEHNPQSKPGHAGSTNPNSTVALRLQKLQTTIDKVTDDAWKHSSMMSSSSSSLLMNHNSSPRSSMGEDDNASFLLGMDLFGQDPMTLERGIQDKLESVEKELQRVLQLSEDNLEEGVDMEDDQVETEEDLSASIQMYQKQIAFLKEASLARSALEESATLASPALTAEPNVSHASEQLVVAKKHVDEAESLAHTYASMQQYEASQHSKYIAIVQGLQHSLRRQRVDLIHKASSVLDNSILVSSNELSVKSSTQLHEAYHVLETLEGGPLALEETIRRWTTRHLYGKALSPLLEPLREMTSETISSLRLSPWKIQEFEDQPTKRIIGVSTSTTKGVIHRLTWHRLEEDTSSSSSAVNPTTLEGPIAIWTDTFQALHQILVFVQSKVLLERSRLCHLVGTKLFGKPTALPSQLHLTALGLESIMLGDDNGVMMEELEPLLASTCLPDKLDATQVSTLLPARCEELVAICEPFCNELTKRGLMPEAEASDDSSTTGQKPTSNKLIAFCKNFPQRYVDHRRCVLLNQARDILKTRDYHNTTTVGVAENEISDPNMAIFLLHRSSISQVASELMTLLRDTMTESTLMPHDPPSVATLRATLYRTAREMLSLYRAVIPTLYGHEIATVPRTAAVLHNDAIFFAHHCLTIGVEYKEQYKEEDAHGKLLRQACIFVDMVPLFRELADQSLGDMLDVQANQLVELVGQRIESWGPSLQSQDSRQEWSEAETALAAGIYHLRHLAQSWRPILSEPIFRQSMGHLADVLLTLYGKQVTPPPPRLHVISPNARHFLLGLFRKAMADLKEVVLPPGLLGKKGNANPLTNKSPDSLFSKGQPSSAGVTSDTNDVTTTMEDCCTEWGRFQALLQFLDTSNLSQVQAALANGVFRKVSGPELAQWIQALYPEGEEIPVRRSLLQSLGMNSAGA